MNELFGNNPFYVADGELFLPHGEETERLKVDTTILFTEPEEVLLKIYFPEGAKKYLLPKQDSKLKSDLEEYIAVIESSNECEACKIN